MGYITHALWQNPYKEADGSKERQCLLLDERGMHLQHYAPKLGKKKNFVDMITRKMNET